MSKELKKCGTISCDKQIDYYSHACENHRNYKWGICNACENASATHTIYDITDKEKIERKVGKVKVFIDFQKTIIQKYLTLIISTQLRQELNEAYQKLLEAEKNIPELQKLTREHEEKHQSCRSNLVQEKGGKQINIYHYNFCDSCGNELIQRESELENNYQVEVKNKLKVFSPEILDKIAEEIGVDQALKINIDLYTNEHVKNTDSRFWLMLSDLPKFKNKSNRKVTAEKLREIKQYFENNHILQINEGGSHYTIWYANGNIEEVPDWRFDAYNLIRGYFWNFSKGNCMVPSSISLHELNNSPKLNSYFEKENQTDTNITPNQKPNKPENNDKKKSLSLTTLEQIKKYFLDNKIREIRFVDGQIIITHNNNNNNNEIFSSGECNSQELSIIEDYCQTNNKKNLSQQELNNILNTNSTVKNPQESKNILITLLAIGGTLVIGIISIGLLIRKRNLKKR